MIGSLVTDSGTKNLQTCFDELGRNGTLRVRPFALSLSTGERKRSQAPLKHKKLALIVFAWLAVFPISAFAGHGVEDTIDTITADRVKMLLDSGEKVVLLDLRPTKEFEQNRLPGARSLPMTDLEKRFSEIPKSGRVVLYCACKPNEAADKAVFLEYRGYRNIFVMLEGYPGWVKRGYPVETTRK
jgi:rhodanese-related sulfurtransferase